MAFSLYLLPFHLALLLPSTSIPHPIITVPAAKRPLKGLPLITLLVCATFFFPGAGSLALTLWSLPFDFS